MKHQDSPSLWFAWLLGFIGLFSFDFQIETSAFNRYSFPILPLGVGIFYLVTWKKREKWLRYRRYLWAGFAVNFVFLALSLIEPPLYEGIYQKDELQTYIQADSELELIITHPSGEQVSLERHVLFEAGWRRTALDGAAFYTGAIWEDGDGDLIDEKDRVEAFPYLLIGVKSKEGSGLYPQVFVERDGQGLLIQLESEHLYFRSETPVLVGGDTNE